MYFLLISLFSIESYLLSLCFFMAADITATFLLSFIILSGLELKLSSVTNLPIMKACIFRINIMINKKENTVAIPKIMKFIDSPINVKTPSLIFFKS
tara:strand:- start:194 stop:484 length:291 start_codon:yes stop_codon:yes gene_type:complete